MKTTTYIRLYCIIIFLVIIILFQCCAVIEPNELGLKVHLGVLSNDVLSPGPMLIIQSFQI